MIWSGFLEGGYTEGIAVSDNGDITGNRANLDVPLFGKSGGHGIIFNDLDGKTYVCNAFAELRPAGKSNIYTASRFGRYYKN